jgi:predicted nucleic acid-binding protein
LKKIFADASFYIGFLNRADQYHELAVQVDKRLFGYQIYTSEMVITEALNSLSKFGPWVRIPAVLYVHKMQDKTYVVEQTHELFEQALQIYQQYRDKAWSLTDCSSFVIMEDLEINDVLTTDAHFKQMGRRNLMQIAE